MLQLASFPLVLCCVLLLQLLHNFPQTTMAQSNVSAAIADMQPIAYKLPTPPTFRGALAANYLLENAEYILNGTILGPESIEVQQLDGRTVLYTGTLDAKVLKIVNGSIAQTIQLVAVSFIEKKLIFKI